MALSVGSEGTPPLVRLLSTEQPCEAMQLRRVMQEDLPFNSSKFEMSVFTVEPGGQTPLDQHQDSEVWLVAQGKGLLRFRGEYELAVKAGDVMRFLPNESHTLKNTGAERLTVFSVWWTA